MKNKRRYGLLLIILIMTLTGCSLEKERPLVRVPEESDQETEFSMAYVQKGELVYGIEEELQLDNYKEKSYGFEVKRMDATMLEDIEFDQLFVNVGDTVKAGDPIVEVDIRKLSANYDMSTMLIITNPNEKVFEFIEPQAIKRGQSVVK